MSASIERGISGRPAVEPDYLRRVLVCPHCQERLEIDRSGTRCTNSECGSSFVRCTSGMLDLRPQRPKTVTRWITIENQSGGWQFEKTPLAQNPTPEVDWSGIERPATLRARMQTCPPRAKTAGAVMLDVGCGAAQLQSIFEPCGFKYVGVDIAGEQATLRADARTLPFGDETFEFAWSNAALQYVPHSDVALAEIYRIMRPGARFMGTVGFLEAFDGANFHPMTWLGAHQCFSDAGFEVEHLAPDDLWTGPIAITSALFSRFPKGGLNIFVGAMDWLFRQYWRIGTFCHRDLSEQDRLIKMTGGFEFILRKTQ